MRDASGGQTARHQVGRPVHADQGPRGHRRPHRHPLHRAGVDVVVHPRRQPGPGRRRPLPADRRRRHHAREQPPLGRRPASATTSSPGTPRSRPPTPGSDKAVPPQLGQLEALTLDIAARTAISGRAIQRDTDQLVAALARLKVEQPSPAPSAAVRTLLQSVKAETDKLRNDISSLTGRETAVIASQQSDIHTSNIFLPAIAIAAVVLALAGGVMVSQLFTTGVVRRLRRLERATEDLERGETPVEVPSGRDEIGRLSARLLDTTAQLRERAEERDRARAELENILTASPVVSLRYDVATRGFSYASPNIDRLLGISAEEAIAAPATHHRTVPSRLGRPAARRARRPEPGATGNASRSCMRFRRDPDLGGLARGRGRLHLGTGPDGELQGARRLPRRRVGASRGATCRRRTPVPPRVHLPRVARHHRRARHLGPGRPGQLAAGRRDRDHRHRPRRRRPGRPRRVDRPLRGRRAEPRSRW